MTSAMSSSAASRSCSPSSAIDASIANPISARSAAVATSRAVSSSARSAAASSSKIEGGRGRSATKGLRFRSRLSNASIESTGGAGVGASLAFSASASIDGGRASFISSSSLNVLRQSSNSSIKSLSFAAMAAWNWACMNEGTALAEAASSRMAGLVSPGSTCSSTKGQSSSILWLDAALGTHPLSSSPSASS